MNKTININLGGFFFHIDESAYQILKKYLEAISRSLSDDPKGKDEILADIEARISELLSETIQDSRQVINEDDIQSIIKIMGQPEDYADVDEPYNDYSSSYQRNTTPKKKLFRDGEDKFLGGVAAGIGHYFNIDPIWIRIALILLLPAGGFGVYTYVILWVLIPEAKTTAEKLQMQGEPVNIDNIEKKIRTEFENVSNKIKNADYSGVKSGFQNFLDVLGTILIRFFQIISKIIGVVLIIIAVTLLIVFIISAFSFSTLEFIGFNESLVSNLPFLYQSVLPSWLLSICLFTTVGIPLIMLFYLGTRIVSSSVRQMNKVVSLTLLGVWIVSFLTIALTGVEFHSQNAYNGSKINSKTINTVATDSIFLKVVNDDNLFFKNKLGRSSNQTIIVENDVEKLYSSNLFINIKRSETDSTYIKIRRKSQGTSNKNAAINADLIEYDYTMIDHELILDSYFLSPVENRFKYEAVTVNIYIPNGATLYFNKSAQNFLHQYHTVGRKKPWQLIHHHFRMTNEGLKCSDCFKKENNNQL
ncbi:PspC domain-containing protein [Wenyingzhuangia sp. IMCC45574]